ncbi:hypothetical protein DRO97_02375 [Archaeoglobales archaeon]|nr:MAG: hypothetical protein DRO97_02375 [Archaeoglobales archaeon]
MVKCYVCGNKFETNEEFYQHIRDKHGSIEEAIYEIVELQLNPKEFTNFIKEITKKVPGFIECEYDGKVAKIRKLRGVIDNNFHISVWDCKGTLICGHMNDAEDTIEVGYFNIPKRIYKPEYEKELENLCWEVIEDRGGAINISGIYYLDEEHIKKLTELVFDLKQKQ